MKTTIIFDMGNTLIAYPTPSKFPTLIDGLAERAGIEQRVVSRAIQIYMNDRERNNARNIETTIHESFTKALHELEATIDSYAFNELMHHVFSHLLSRHSYRITGAQKLLEQLSSDGYSLGIISNIMFDGKLPYSDFIRYEIAEHFDDFVWSSEVGIKKPDAKIFEISLTNLGSSPEDSVYIGDTLDRDVQGALSAGITPIWFNPDKKAVPEGILHVTSLLEIPDILRQL